jgi:hypothetical protein
LKSDKIDQINHWKLHVKFPRKFLFTQNFLKEKSKNKIKNLSKMSDVNHEIKSISAVVVSHLVAQQMIRI